MKTLTIPEDVHDCAERQAAERGESLAEFVIGLLTQANEARISEARHRMAELFVALDKGRNRIPVGPLNRDELGADPCVLIRARDGGKGRGSV